MSPRAVFFDFDGVIADTENVHVAAWERTFGAMGWDVAPEVCARAAEVDDRAFLAELFARRAIPDGDVDGWVRRKQKLALEMLSDAPRLYAGVADLVARLRGRARLAVVSTTWRENIDVALRSSALADAFELIVAKEDVRVPKPDPECYRLALKRLRIDPTEAVALEDSVTGLAAAKGAGLRCLAVGHRLPDEEWTKGAVYLSDLTNRVAVLRAIGLDP
jgi:HAD superfamily hydrolase (TIGR01509 family)